MNTREWIELADSASQDPSLSQDVARRLAHEIRAALERGEGDAVPWGYLYAGAYRMVARVESLEPEPIDADNPNLFGTSQESPQVTWRVPFAMLVLGVSASAVPRYAVSPASPWPFSLGSALEGRDLFNARWELNGSVDYQTTGNSQDLMLPASQIAGTGNRPRPLAWLLGRRDVVSFSFRNATNFYGDIFGVTLAHANITMHCLRMDPP